MVIFVDLRRGTLTLVLVLGLYSGQHGEAARILQRRAKKVLDASGPGDASGYTSHRKNASIKPVANEDPVKVFKQFDKNGDDKLTTAETEAMLKSVAWETNDVKEVLDWLGRHKMSTFSLQLWLEYSNGLPGAFNNFDKQKKGYIDKADLLAYFTEIGDNVKDSEAQKMIDDASGGTGTIDYEDFKRMFQNLSL
mmetsp:Transcript_6625/g.10637  ORF Transcript_6625/g.10637 Transcript_6625/m.10637 type:complete len:194 (+) Transcript_6625:40-621(+)